MTIQTPRPRPRQCLRLQPTDIAWITLAGYVVSGNVLLTEPLSVAVDRYLLTRRRTTECVLLALYLHLSNHVPPRLDPIHLLFAALVRPRA